ncbi:MAG: tetratricopeptide repeat protein [Candidatus Kapaibacterium sp.]
MAFSTSRMLDLEQAKQEIAKAPSQEERLRLLLLHSKDFYRNAPKQAEKWAREALKLATKLKDAEGVARAHYNIGATEFQQAQYSAAEASFKKALDLDRPEFESPLLEGPIFTLGLVYAQQGKFKEAFEHYERALVLCRKHGRSSEVSILNEMGNAAIELADYPRALKYLYDALAILDTSDDVTRRSIVLTNIARVYLEVRDLEKADNLFARAASLSKETGDTNNLCSAIYNRGIIASKQGDKNSARVLFTESLSLAKSVDRRNAEAYISDSYGHLALEEGKNKEAIQYFEQAIALSKEMGLKTVWCLSLIGLGSAYLASKKPAQTIKLLQVSLTMSSEAGMLNAECECLGVLAKAFEAAGKLKDAVEYFNRFIVLNATVHSQERQRAIVEVQARVEIEKADRERARMENIAKDASERAELLRAESDRQSQELTALALQLVEKNEFLCDLKEEIEPALKSSKKAKAISQRIDDHIKSDRDWETFENQFNQVHGGFLRELSARYPTLTPAELKIAILTRLNLSTKAMANLLCLSIRTAENHRQNIRNKLRLSTDANLVTFLTGLGGIE